MINLITKSTALLLLVQLVHSQDVPQRNATTTTNVTTTSSLFTYAGSELPSDWTLLSVLNDRAVIAFQNGSSRNALLTELSPEDQDQVKRVQNKALLATPLGRTKERLAQWASSASTAVTKFSKGIAESMGNIFKSDERDPKRPVANMNQ